MLETLRQTAIFMVASKMVLHFFPGSKFDRYGKMMVALIVLSQLCVPILNFFQKDIMEEFFARTDLLEAQNEMFSEKLEDFGEGQEGLLENALVLSVEERVGMQAQEAGVQIRQVSARDGIVVIEVEALARTMAQGAIEPVEPVKIERIGQTQEEGASEPAGEKRRPDLAAVFARQLGMEEGRVEVIER